MQVFDIIRKKYIALTPEEWVRQHVIHFLAEEKNFPKGLMETEKEIALFNTKKRIDILVRSNELKPLLLIECKEPSVKLSQKEAEQLARYQLSLQCPYSMLTNGLSHIVIHSVNEKISFLPELPDFNLIIKQDNC